MTKTLSDTSPLMEDAETIRSGFDSLGYIASKDISTAVYLAYHLEKPILIEGPPGVSATAVLRRA